MCVCRGGGGFPSGNNDCRLRESVFTHQISQIIFPHEIVYCKDMSITYAAVILIRLRMGRVHLAEFA